MLLKFLGDLKQKQRVAVTAVSVTAHSHTFSEEEDSDGDKVPAMEFPAVEPENIPCAESINFLKLLRGFLKFVDPGPPVPPLGVTD